jgi:hypothetical protein
MSGLLESQEYQDIFRLIESRGGYGTGGTGGISYQSQLYYLHIGSVRKYLEDASWKGFTEEDIIETVKRDIDKKRQSVSQGGCFLIIDFNDCGIFNKTLLGLCPKIIKQIIGQWMDIVWGSYIIRPNSFTTFFLKLIMVFIPKDKHDKMTIVKGGIFELLLLIDKVGRPIEEKQWLRLKMSQ